MISRTLGRRADHGHAVEGQAVQEIDEGLLEPAKSWP
jgi:hypothetical protein